MVARLGKKNYLELLKQVNKDNALYLCTRCGKKTIKDIGRVKNNQTRSCGCLKSEYLQAHGKSKKPEDLESYSMYLINYLCKQIPGIRKVSLEERVQAYSLFFKLDEPAGQAVEASLKKIG